MFAATWAGSRRAITARIAIAKPPEMSTPRPRPYRIAPARAVDLVTHRTGTGPARARLDPRTGQAGAIDWLTVEGGLAGYSPSEQNRQSPRYYGSSQWNDYVFGR